MARACAWCMCEETACHATDNHLVKSSRWLRTWWQTSRVPDTEPHVTVLESPARTDDWAQATLSLIPSPANQQLGYSVGTSTTPTRRAHLLVIYPVPFSPPHHLSPPFVLLALNVVLKCSRLIRCPQVKKSLRSDLPRLTVLNRSFSLIVLHPSTKPLLSRYNVPRLTDSSPLSNIVPLGLNGSPGQCIGVMLLTRED